MVYVDECVEWGFVPGRRALGNQWCHLFADTEEELHAFAAEIGLKRTWFQPHRVADHYDLVPSKRALAVKRGAQEVTATQYVRDLLRKRQEVQACG